MQRQDRGRDVLPAMPGVDGGVPLAGPLPGMEPDQALTVNYKAFPHVFVPPFHYVNPVTGK